VDLNDLANIYDLRRIIEIEIGRRSVSRMTKNDVEAVRGALASFQAVANDPSSAEFWERHRQFHWALLAPAANATVKRVLNHLWQSSERYVRLFVSTFATWIRSWTFTLSFTKRARGEMLPLSRTRSSATTWKLSKPFATDLNRYRRFRLRLPIHFSFSDRCLLVFTKRGRMSRLATKPTFEMSPLISAFGLGSRETIATSRSKGMCWTFSP
jgi:hypothetical protein